MRRAENLEQWLSAVMDGTNGFCARAALFAVEGKSLVCRAVRGLERIPEAVPLEAAPALASAADSQDTVVAVCTAGELSKTIADAYGAGTVRKAHLIPLNGRKRSLAVLYAEETTDLDALELLMAIAASAREYMLAAAPVGENQLVGISGTASASVVSDDEFRARRFAQSRVAEIRLVHEDLVQTGRAQGDLYSRLRGPLNEVREAYAREFRNAEFADYLHLEIVRSLANDDATILGSEYPGPLA